MIDSECAQKMLTENYTCVLVKGDNIYTSKKAGIAPMIEFIERGVDLKGFSVADKIVGKAVSMLFVLAGIKDVYAQTMSRSAKEFLDRHNVPNKCEKLVDRIINRKGDDICPMEKTVLDIASPELAFTALKEKLNSMRNGMA